MALNSQCRLTNVNLNLIENVSKVPKSSSLFSGHRLCLTVTYCKNLNLEPRQIEQDGHFCAILVFE